MVNNRRLIAGFVCSVILCYSAILCAMESETLFSENTAERFISHASQIHQEDPLDVMRTKQAIAFLEAATALDASLGQIPEMILRIGAESSGEDSNYLGLMMWALEKYFNNNSDLQVAFDAVGNMLSRFNSRIERESFLNSLLQKYSSENPAFASELATQLGLLATEKADMQSAMNYFSGAYSANPYNELAFSKLMELAQGQEIPLRPSLKILHIRQSLEMNPYDLNLAIQYADTLRQLQMYDLASSAYAYAEQVHKFMYPNQELPDDIVQGWLFSCYHGDRLQTKGLGLTETYRDPQHFNLILEAIAGKTLIKLGRDTEGRELLMAAAKKAEKLVTIQDPSQPVLPEYLAWYYSFVLEEPDKSLAWSNKAFVADPNRQGVQAIFAYSLIQNGQNDLAKQYAEPLKESDQIAALTMAIVQLSADDKKTALDSLRDVVAMSPDSFVAEKAMRLLTKNDSNYIPPAELETIREELQNTYSSRVIPDFITPKDRCEVRLLFNGSDFLYGADLSGRLVLKNTSEDELVITNGGFVHGQLRVDAVLEGSLNVKIPNLLSMRFRPSKPIMPGKHLSIPLNLNRGRLGRLLKTYPQADVQIHFTVYLDPVITESGEIENRMKGLEPVRFKIRRRGVLLTRDFLLQRLDVLSKGQVGQKYRAATLFTGLLAEDIAIGLSGADFKHVRLKRELLTDSVRKMLVDDDWKIRVHTLSCLLSLSISLDGIIKDVSENLNHDKWPVRLMAMVLLRRAQPETFQKVLDWAAEHDPHNLNRSMAIALGGREPQPEPVPAETPLESLD